MKRPYASIDLVMPDEAFARAGQAGPAGGVSRPICGRNPYSRMGARSASATLDGVLKALQGKAGPLPPAARDRAAGGLWFSPGASRHDVMMALYDPERGARPEPNGTSQLSKWSEGLPPDF